MPDIRAKERLLRRAAAALSTEPDQLPAVIEKFHRELSEARAEIARLKAQLKRSA